MQVVVVTVEYAADRSVRLTVHGSGQAVEVATGLRCSETGPRAHAAVRELFGDEDVTVDLRVPAPPWVQVGDFVRIRDTSDTLDGTSTPFGQVVGFLPVGGILVVHPEAGAGVFSPDDVDVVPVGAVDLRWLDAITRRSGIPFAR